MTTTKRRLSMYSQWLLQSFLLCVVFWSLPSYAAVVDPILAIPITDEFLNDVVIRGYFADVLSVGGFGFRQTERAAFLVLEQSGIYRCVLWPYSGGIWEQTFRGVIPIGTVAIIHTHPMEWPFGSPGDQTTAIRLAVPIFVLTPRNIYLVTSRGENVPVVKDRMWADATAASSRRCTPASRAFNSATAAVIGHLNSRRSR